MFLAKILEHKTWVALALLAVFLVFSWRSGVGERALLRLNSVVTGEAERRLKETEVRERETTARLAVEQKKFEAEKKRLLDSIARADVEISKRDSAIAKLSQRLDLEIAARVDIDRRLRAELAEKLSPSEIHERLRAYGH